MDKRKVNEHLPQAFLILKEVGIANPANEIQFGFRSQISGLGAAITTGSLLAAVLAFSQQGGSDVDRKKITEAIKKLIAPNENETLFNILVARISKNRSYSREEEVKQKEIVVNAAIALKLAMNEYKLIKKKDNEA